MTAEEWIRAGKILKTHGHKGHLLIAAEASYERELLSQSCFFLEVFEEKVPFFITLMEQAAPGTAIVRFEEAGTPEEARRLTGSAIFIPKKALTTATRSAMSLSDLSGYSVHDKVFGPAGVIESILEMPQQKIMKIRLGTREILIPLVRDILLRKDRKKKILYINAPDGLIEMYLK